MSARDPDPAAFASRRVQEGMQFVRRMYLPRAMGLALGAVAIAPVLWANQASAPVWLILGIAAFVWPHLAYMLGASSTDPYNAERRNLMVDSMLGGAFIALMKFNLLPSVLLLVMLSMDKLAVGGPKFLARCTVGLVAACAAVVWVAGFEARPDTTMLQIVGCLPLLVVYPLAVGITTYNMAKRMRYQSRQLEAMSRTEGLSQMLTRQAWEDSVSEEFAYCRRAGQAATILLLEIDDLKAINLRHGYPTGDEVIRSVAVILRNALRGQDVAGRYGSDAFAVLLPGAGAALAEQVGARAREAIRLAVLEQSGRVSATVSIGLAELQPADSHHREWLAHADEALQSARHKGGDITIRWSASAEGRRDDAARARSRLPELPV